MNLAHFSLAVLIITSHAMLGSSGGVAQHAWTTRNGDGERISGRGTWPMTQRPTPTSEVARPTGSRIAAAFFVLLFPAQSGMASNEIVVAMASCGLLRQQSRAATRLGFACQHSSHNSMETPEEAFEPSLVAANISSVAATKGCTVRPPITARRPVAASLMRKSLSKRDHCLRKIIHRFSGQACR